MPSTGLSGLASPLSAFGPTARRGGGAAPGPAPVAHLLPSDLWTADLFPADTWGL